MPALNFQKQFAPLVESGEKRQTIRAYRKDGRDPKPGDTLYLYTGMRTKACRKLGEVECKSASEVMVFRRGAVMKNPDDESDRIIRNDENFDAADAFAEEDGFGSMAEMAAWFEKTHGLPFEGLLIRW